jgi:hypothetical protein
MKRERKDKWAVYGEYGGHFTNLIEAKQCAKEASKLIENEEVSILLIEDGIYYIDYLNGKCIRDGWTIKKK